MEENELYRLWSETTPGPEIPTEEPLRKTWKKIRAAERRQSRRLFMRRALRYAAILLLPLLAGTLAWKAADRKYAVPEMIECYVPNGNQQTVTLPDGSVVRINAGSLLIYPSRFTASGRQVYLSGEANFSVRSHSGNPFTVRSGALSIEALGTKFNVESYPGSGLITTTLEHGSVKVYLYEKPDEAILMQPDEQVSFYAAGHRFVRSHVESTDYSAWTEGELRFINKSLDEILFTLERRYNVRFLVDTSVKGSDMYTMKFKAHETIDDALYVLGEIIGSVIYHKEGQTVRIKLKRKEVAR